MTTIINTKGETAANFINLLIGTLVFLVAVAVFVLYGLPAIRGTDTPSQEENGGNVNVNIKLPEGGTQSSDQSEEGGSLYKD